MNGSGQPSVPPWLQPAQFAVAFALLFLLPQLLTLLAQQQGLWQPESAIATKTAVGMGAFLLSGGLLVAFARHSPPAVRWRPVAARAVLAIYLPFALAWFLFVIGYLRLLHGLGHAVAPQPQLQLLATLAKDTPGFWLLVAGIVVAAPLGEELVFRGYLLGAMQLVLPLRAAQWLTAAAFGLLHGPDYALPVAGLGLLFGHLRQRHAALWPSVLAHALHNGITVLLTVCWPGTLDFLYPR